MRSNARWSLILLAGTGANALFQEADLLAERVDAVQLLERVGQEGGLLRHTLVQRQGVETVKRSQHQL